MNTRVNYDQIAPTYNQRYAANKLEGVAATLLSLARESSAKQVLEVGCGTGHWLTVLQPPDRLVYGLDLSLGMLRQASVQEEQRCLVCGQAVQLPFSDNTFDLVSCVNAIHHFDQPRVFVFEARRLLKPGSALAIVGIDPHGRQDSWYVYQYFAGTYETDLNRIPSWGTVLDWMIAADFRRISRSK